MKINENAEDKKIEDKKKRSNSNRDNDNEINNNISQGGNEMKVLTIEGMMCGHCKANVEKVLLAVEGVASAVVDLDAKTATVELSGDVADDVLIKVVDEAGYTFVSIV